MKLTSTRQEYEFADGSGYRFTVVAEKGAGQWDGWSATVTMSTRGLVSAETAIQALRSSAEAFLRQLGGAA